MVAATEANVLGFGWSGGAMVDDGIIADELLLSNEGQLVVAFTAADDVEVTFAEAAVDWFAFVGMNTRGPFF